MNPFVIETNEKDGLRKLACRTDRYAMNWVKKESLWGIVNVPHGISCSVKRILEEDDTFVECYRFINQTAFPIYLQKTDIGIAVSLPDYYSDAKECMHYCCHTHIWCGGSSAWILALRMGGESPHLGMVVTEGEISSYSLIRDEKKQSNDRGTFLLHPELLRMDPGQACCITFKWFWVQDPTEFDRKKRAWSPAITICLDKGVWFAGEDACLELYWKAPAEDAGMPEAKLNESKVWFDKPVFLGNGEKKTVCHLSSIEKGKWEAIFSRNGKKSTARLWISAPLKELIQNRCRFITEKQQEKGGILDGAYLIYDQETGKRYYAHLDDHNAGRERLGMGALIALWLQETESVYQAYENSEMRGSLDWYVKFVYRELIDPVSGNVFNDVNRNREWDRLYNYPWMSVFLLEVYRLTHDIQYLLDSSRVLFTYYGKGGGTFYAIGLPAEEVICELNQADEKEQAEELKKMLLQHADHIMENGLDFPKSEVNYEQSIVAPAADILLQAYACSKEIKYLETAEEMVELLLLFNGDQPDCHMFENAIRHWDGYWFGKRRLYGDTFPHYWSVLTGVCLAKYTLLTGQDTYRKRAEASLRGSLMLFSENGEASCAFLYPETINGKPGHYLDPWANDQDWALYYAWKYRDFTEGKEEC